MSRVEMSVSLAKPLMATSMFMTRVAVSTEVVRPHWPAPATMSTNARRMPNPAKRRFPMGICWSIVVFLLCSDSCRGGGGVVDGFHGLLQFAGGRDAVEVGEEAERGVSL